MFDWKSSMGLYCCMEKGQFQINVASPPKCYEALFFSLVSPQNNYTFLFDWISSLGLYCSMERVFHNSEHCFLTSCWNLYSFFTWWSWELFLLPSFIIWSTFSPIRPLYHRLVVSYRLYFLKLVTSFIGTISSWLGKLVDVFIFLIRSLHIWLFCTIIMTSSFFFDFRLSFVLSFQDVTLFRFWSSLLNYKLQLVSHWTQFCLGLRN